MGKSIHERWKEDAYYYEKRAAEDEGSRERAKKKMEQIKANLKVNQDKIKQTEERVSKKNR